MLPSHLLPVFTLFKKKKKHVLVLNKSLSGHEVEYIKRIFRAPVDIFSILPRLSVLKEIFSRITMGYFWFVECAHVFVCCIF